MKNTIRLSMKIVALFTILSFFTSGCSLVDDILRALENYCGRTDLTVTTTDDIFGNSLCTAASCSLRQAIQASNACPGVQTIHIPATPASYDYALTLTGAGEDNNRTGDLDITDSVNIIGTVYPPHQLPYIDGRNSDRVFDIHAGATVNMTDLVVVNGRADNGGGIRNYGTLNMHGSQISSNSASGLGGGIYSAGNLSIDNTAVSQNTSGSGGGIAMDNPTAAPISFNMTASYLGQNTAAAAGGGIYISGRVNAALPLGTSVNAITLNQAARGGGIFNSGNLTVDRLFLDANTASEEGGGLSNRSGSASIARSNITNNHADGPESGNGGGGLFNASDSVLTVNNSTISQNKSNIVGGGIVNFGNLLIAFSTISNNNNDGLNLGSPSSATISNSIVADNAVVNCDLSGPVLTSNGFNIDSANSCGFGQPSDLASTDPLLQPLANDGGDTRNQALSPGSPAVDSANSSTCPATDQRGVARPQGPRCDRGAYELEVGGAASPITPTYTPTPSTSTPTATIPTPPGGLTYTSTAAPVLVVVTPPGITFGQPTLSTDHFFSGGGGCGVLDVKFQVGVSNPGQGLNVFLFFHLEDKNGSGSTPWNNGVAMQPLGQGMFSYDLASQNIPAFNSYQEAWLVYQFAASGPDGKVVLRSQTFNNLTLSMCGKK